MMKSNNFIGYKDESHDTQRPMLNCHSPIIIESYIIFSDKEVRFIFLGFFLFVLNWA